MTFPKKFTRLALAQALAVISLAACGGGGGGAGSETSTAGVNSAAAAEGALNVGTGSWEPVANEYDEFTVDGTQLVRLGEGSRWIEKTVTGNGVCRTDFFGDDPAIGVIKTCQVYVPNGGTTAVSPAPAPARSGTPAPAPAPAARTGTTSSLGVLPANPRLNAGVGTDQLGSTSEQAQPSADGTGDFRTRCLPSHFSFDNPVAYPGQPGAAPMQLDFGNTGANANSSAQSLSGSGNSTCRGGTVNRSSYAVPALIDTGTNLPVVPDESDFYYKSGYLGVTPSSIQLMPPGLRMLAGNANNSADNGFSSPYTWVCHNSGINRGQTIPTCPIGDQLELSIAFPQCWDGVNLDSADHRSHMAYATGHGCPASHPIALAEVSFHILYPVTDRQGYWRLSSDTYSGPAGYSAHASWFNGWQQDVSDSWSRNCVAAGRDCHSHLLGDGRTIQ